MLEKSVGVFGKRMQYRLIAVRRGTELVYQIAVGEGAEEERVTLGEELLWAVGLWERTVRGEVLPGNLAEIVEDCRYERHLQN